MRGTEWPTWRYVALALAACFAAGAVVAALAGVAAIRFWQGYTAIYACGALVYAVLAWRRAMGLQP